MHGALSDYTLAWAYLVGAMTTISTEAVSEALGLSRTSRAEAFSRQ